MNQGFTESQLAVLAEIEGNRLSVVRAGPGAGKTRVFVEAFRRELAQWTSRRAGIAALSFTNVAHEVISDRLGSAPEAPHFIGTLDAFLWRFVVRPFGHLAGVTRDGPTLIPAPLDELLSSPQVKFGPQNHQTGSIFRVGFTGGTEANPELFHRGERIGLAHPYAAWNLDRKRKEWATRGRITHSDSQFLASCILKGNHGSMVIELLTRRFPVVFVDEFQDTGWFLSRALLALLTSQRVRGAVVGDPDQAIYQFGGAHRGLFGEAEKITGRKGCLLDESHRCPPKVAAVATALSRSGKRVVAQQTKSEGRAILLVHTQDMPSLDPLRAKVSELVGSTDFTVLARKGTTVKQLTGTVAAGSCPWQSGVAQRLSRAVEHLLAREPGLAARLVRRELCDLLLGDESPTTDALLRSGIAVTDWRAACHAILMEAASAPAGETWNAWLYRLKQRFADEAGRVGKSIDAKTLGARFKKAAEGGDAIRRAVVPAHDATTQVAMTVHQAKGCEFDAVLFYVPKPHARHAPCPADEWWSADPTSEEREVAFVACSRARMTLVLAVHKKTHEALKAKRLEFLGHFEVHELASQGSDSPGTGETASVRRL